MAKRGGKRPNAGRKSGYQEKQDAERLNLIWRNPQVLIEITEKLNKREQLSLEEMFIAHAFKGSERFLEAIFKKVHPDSVKLSGSIESKSFEEIAKALREAAKKNEN